MAGEGTEGWKRAGAVVICKMWRLAVALQLLEVQCRVNKWSISPVPNPIPVESHVVT
jgi:hypothetical protein